jgi:hypothetical protein
VDMWKCLTQRYLFKKILTHWKRLVQWHRNRICLFLHTIKCTILCE